MIIPPGVVYGFGALLIVLLVLVLVLLLHTGPQGAGGASVNLDALRVWLEGKKSYICAVLLAVNNYAARKGYIDAALASDLNTALALLTGAAVIAKMNRIEQKTEVAVTAAKIAAIPRPTDPPVKEGI
jgi:hypothetical protein